MHRLLASICFLCCVLSGVDAQAQGFVVDSVKYGPDTVYITPDITAAFPGGKGKMMDYIDLKFDVTVDGMTDVSGAKGESIDASFVVEANGRVKYVSIDKSASPAYDEELTRSLTTMPKWEPAVVNGRKVRSLQKLHYTLNFGRQ